MRGNDPVVVETVSLPGSIAVFRDDSVHIDYSSFSMPTNRMHAIHKLATLCDRLCGVRRGGQFPQHGNEQLLLFHELRLAVYCSVIPQKQTPVRKEIEQVGDQLLRVLLQNQRHLGRLVGVGHEHLKHVEGLVLDNRLRSAQDLHDQYEVVHVPNVCDHYIKVHLVQEEFVQQLHVTPGIENDLQRHAARDVLLAADERGVPAEDLLVQRAIWVHLLTHELLVAAQQVLDRAERVRAHLEGRGERVLREERLDESGAIKQKLVETALSDALPQHDSAVQCNLGILVTVEESGHDLLPLLRQQVLRGELLVVLRYEDAEHGHVHLSLLIFTRFRSLSLPNPFLKSEQALWESDAC